MALYRILAVDYGEKRVGIALSDPLCIISKPYTVLENSGNLFAELNEIISKQNVSKIILGIPYNLEGKESQKTREVLQFAGILKKHISIPLIYWDERFTTVEANEALKNMGYNSREARKVVDKVAASIILKGYLTSIS